MARPARASVLIAGTTLALLLGAALLAPWLVSADPSAVNLDQTAHAPALGTAHPLGTDRLGRDVLARSLQGLRVSVLIGVAAAAASVVIGVLWGMIAGFAGGRTGAVMMRIVDVLYALPYVFLVILLATVFGRGNLLVLLIAIASVGWLTMARIVRAQSASLREREFMLAARALGLPRWRILLRHAWPNLAGPVLAYAALTVPQTILYESFLSFLGLGVQEPLASLGGLIADGVRDMQTAPWLLLIPAALLISLVLALNLIGDALRDAHDPHATA